MIGRLFTNQLPPWARPSHPMMRYTLGYKAPSRRAALGRFFLVALLAAVAVAMGYLYTVSELPADQSARYREFMYFPVVAGGIITQILALAMTTNFLAIERQKETWDSLHITLVGAGMSVRTRWALVFYRLRWVLLALFSARLVYVGLLMWDMTDFQGRAIDVRLGVAPQVSLEVAVMLLAALMTAAIVQPFVAVAFDAAIGLFVAVATRRRNIGILTTVILMIFRLVTSLVALLAGNDIINANGTTANIINISAPEAWFRLLFLSSQGDQSLRLLDLEALGNVWADVDNGIFIGGVVLLVVVAQALFANALVLYSAWRAARPARR